MCFVFRFPVILEPFRSLPSSDFFNNKKNPPIPKRSANKSVLSCHATNIYRAAELHLSQGNFNGKHHFPENKQENTSRQYSNAYFYGFKQLPVFRHHHRRHATSFPCVRWRGWDARTNPSRSSNSTQISTDNATTWRVILLVQCFPRDSFQRFIHTGNNWSTRHRADETFRVIVGTAFGTEISRRYSTMTRPRLQRSSSCPFRNLRWGVLS